MLLIWNKHAFAVRLYEVTFPIAKTIMPHYGHFIIWAFSSNSRELVHQLKCKRLYTDQLFPFPKQYHINAQIQKQGLIKNHRWTVEVMRHQSYQCVWVWGLQRHARLRLNSVAFLSNMHIHCSSLSSLMPPTTGYFSGDQHSTPNASISDTLQLSLQQRWFRQVNTKKRVRRRPSTLRTQEELLWPCCPILDSTLSRTMDSIVLPHIAEWICNNLLILGCRSM